MTLSGEQVLRVLSRYGNDCIVEEYDREETVEGDVLDVTVRANIYKSNDIEELM